MKKRIGFNTIVAESMSKVTANDVIGYAEGFNAGRKFERKRWKKKCEQCEHERTLDCKACQEYQ